MSSDMPALDVECERCGGEGEVPSSVRFGCDSRAHQEKCYDCGGLGRIPTPFGEQVLAFVLSRLRVTAFDPEW